MIFLILQVESIEELLRQVEDGISEYIKVTEELEYERKKHSARIQLQKFKEERENEVHVCLLSGAPVVQ